MSKWDRVRSSFERAHDDFFETSTYTAEFFNRAQGTRDPDADTMINQTRSSIGTAQVEIVPPAIDSTIDTEGTSFDWTTSIRFPESDKPGDLVPLGENSTRPTEVELLDDEGNVDRTFELHGYTTEKGSGMLMCRLVEQ